MGDDKIIAIIGNGLTKKLLTYAKGDKKVTVLQEYREEPHDLRKKLGIF